MALSPFAVVLDPMLDGAAAMELASLAAA